MVNIRSSAMRNSRTRFHFYDCTATFKNGTVRGRNGHRRGVTYGQVAGARGTAPYRRHSRLGRRRVTSKFRPPPSAVARRTQHYTTANIEIIIISLCSKTVSSLFPRAAVLATVDNSIFVVRV